MVRVSVDVRRLLLLHTDEAHLDTAPFIVPRQTSAGPDIETRLLATAVVEEVRLTQVPVGVLQRVHF